MPAETERCAVPDYSGAKNRAITVYCWSRTEPGTPRWLEAEKLGRLAARSGFSVITGGYCGSMEAVSKGAREAIDAELSHSQGAQETGRDGAVCPEVIGVLVPDVFPDRTKVGNVYLTRQNDAMSMMHRIELLTSMSRYFVVLPGTLGTLQELCCIWIQKLLQPRDTDAPVIIAYREPWERCLQGVAASLALPPEQLSLIEFVDNAEEAMQRILADDSERRLHECRGS